MIAVLRNFKARQSSASFISPVGVVTSIAAIFSFAAGYGLADTKHIPSVDQRRQCDLYYEPSGITQLADGRIVVIDDEQSQPISLLTLNEELMLSVETPDIGSLFPNLSEDEHDAAVSDLEAIAADGRGFLYAITSHSRTKSGERSASREQLLRFRVAGNKLEEAGVRVDLRNAIAGVDKNLQAAAKVMDVKSENGFNVEGLSFNKARGELMIGLRSPLVDGHAVIVKIKNPPEMFDKNAAPNVAAEPIYLALDEGGIRAMAFDPKLGGHLIISRQEKAGEEFKLWLWSGTRDRAPRRVHVNHKFDLSNAEGIAPIHHLGNDWVMLAFDNGKKSKRSKGCYAFLAYDQLEVDAPAH